MLEEYALVPDVFDPAAYSNPAYADICLANLKKPFLHEALVRDLRDGAWSRFCAAQAGFHRLAGEILRKLATANRLHLFPAFGADEPGNPADWCRESLDTSNVQPLTGVIAAHATKSEGQFCKDARVASIEKLPGTPWWQNPESHTIRRETSAYLKLMTRILEQANSLMVIDPNLDPSKHNYREVYKLLLPLSSRNPRPTIEIHRSFCCGDGPERTFPTEAEWKQYFAGLGNELQQAGLSAEVFLWQDFHDRYLITDIIGVAVGAGFDTTAAPNAYTTWARLSRQDREEWQRKFDPATRAIDLKGRFQIGVPC
jgi:hypothetical protein